MRFSPKNGLSPYKRPASRRYVMALLFVGVAAATVGACVWFFSLPAFLILIAAVAAAQAYGGMGPGLVAASISASLQAQGTT